MTKLPVSQQLFARPSIFFFFVFLLTFFQIKCLTETVYFESGSLFPYIWVFAFSVLSINISILATQAFFASFVKTVNFPKVNRASIESVPVALLYCIKNEAFGLRERIQYTLSGNTLPNLNLWILSDSNEIFGTEEEKLIHELQSSACEIFYRRRTVPRERKQGNIKDWLSQYGASYQYFIICDADSLLPPGWVEEILQVAEHPRNEKIGVFQSAIYITHERSLFSKMQAIAQFYAQKLYFNVNQVVFGRSIAFGHNCLIRREAFEKIQLPEGILSHDNWETALLENLGYRTIFLSNLISFEEASPHYLEERKRAKRWLKGTLQGWPLLFLPNISFSMRFLIFYQIYLYLVQPILCYWMVSTLFAGRSLFTGNTGHFPLFAFTLGVLFFHKLVVARNLNDVKRMAQETIFSTAIGLQNIFYGTIDFIVMPFEKLGWVPMAKTPDAHLNFSDCVQNFIGGTLIGFTFLWLGLNSSNAWTLFSLPVLLSLMLSIPLVYFSSKNVSKSSYTMIHTEATP